MTSRFDVVEVRPSGKEASRTAQEQASGRSRWDRVVPLRTLLVERPAEADEPTGYWMTNLPSTTPIADLVRWAKMRWRIEHDYRELKHGVSLDHFEGRTWRGWHHHVTLVTAAQAFLTLRRLDPKVAITIGSCESSSPPLDPRTGGGESYEDMPDATTNRDGSPRASVNTRHINATSPVPKAASHCMSGGIFATSLVSMGLTGASPADPWL